MPFKKLIKLKRSKYLKLRAKSKDLFSTPAMQRSVRQFLCQCANSRNLDERIAGLLFYFNMFLWTYNPRKAPHHFPFVPYDFQNEYLIDVETHYFNQKDLLTEKSRDMGATWIQLAHDTFHFLFSDSFNSHILSKKEDDLDDRTIATSFPKIKYMLERMPEWLLPDGFSMTKSYNHLKIYRIDNENSITGESANPDAGVSRRYSKMTLDEFAMNPCGYQIWRGTADTCNCRNPVSTPRGMGNKFAQIRHSGQIDIHRLWWEDHPDKDAEWFKGEQSRRTEEEIAQEILISYHASQGGIVYKEFSHKKHMKDVKYDEDLPLFACWDFGIGDATSIIWIQTLRDEVRIIDAYEDNDKAIDYFVPLAIGKIPTYTKDNKRWPYFYNIRANHKIAEHGKWKKPVHFGDETCRKREQTSGVSVERVLQGYGVNMRHKRASMKDRIDGVKRLLMGKFCIDRSLGDLAEAFENYHWKTDDDGGIMGSRPIHNKYAHYMSAFEYFAVNWRPGMYQDSNYSRSRSQSVHVGDKAFGY